MWADYHHGEITSFLSDIVHHVSNPKDDNTHTGRACDRTSVDPSPKSKKYISKMEYEKTKNEIPVTIVRKGQPVPVTFTRTASHFGKFVPCFSLGTRTTLNIISPEWLTFQVPGLFNLHVEGKRLKPDEYDSNPPVYGTKIVAMTASPPCKNSIYALLEHVFSAVPENFALSSSNKHAFGGEVYSPDDPWYLAYHNAITSLQACDKKSPTEAVNGRTPLPRAVVFAINNNVKLYFACARIDWLRNFYPMSWLLDLRLDAIYSMHDRLRNVGPSKDLAPEKGVMRAFFYTCFSAESHWTTKLGGAGPYDDMELIAMDPEVEASGVFKTRARKELSLTHALQMLERELVTPEFVRHIIIYELIKCVTTKWGNRCILLDDLPTLLKWYMGKNLMVFETIPGVAVHYEKEPRMIRKQSLKDIPDLDIAESLRFLCNVGVIVKELPGIGLPENTANVQLTLHYMQDFCIAQNIRVLYERQAYAAKVGGASIEGVKPEWAPIFDVDGETLGRLDLCSEQLAAFMSIFNRAPVVVCSGKAGSGKSRLGSSIFRVMKPGTALGVAFQGAHASTLGRKIRETGETCIPVSTIHGLLYWHSQICCQPVEGCSPEKRTVEESARRNNITSICYDAVGCSEDGAPACILRDISVVVIDEGGVLYEELFAALLHMLVKCCPNFKTLVILQDPCQLPPVTGGLLGVHIPYALGCVKMQHCHRQESETLRQLYRMILAGQMPPPEIINNQEDCWLYTCNSEAFHLDDSRDDNAGLMFKNLMNTHPALKDDPFSVLPVTYSNEKCAILESTFRSACYLNHNRWKGQRSESFFIHGDGIISDLAMKETYNEGMIICYTSNDPQLGVSTKERLVVIGIERGYAIHVDDFLLHKIGTTLATIVWGMIRKKDVADEEVLDAECILLKRAINNSTLLQYATQCMMGYEVAKHTGRNWHKNEVSKNYNSDHFVRNYLTMYYASAWPLSPTAQEDVTAILTKVLIDEREYPEEVAAELADKIIECMIRPAIQDDDDGSSSSRGARMPNRDPTQPSERALELFFKDRYNEIETSTNWAAGPKNISKGQFFHFQATETLNVCMKNGNHYNAPNAETMLKHRATGDTLSSIIRNSQGEKRNVSEAPMVTMLVCCPVDQYNEMRRSGEVPENTVRLPCTPSCTKKLKHGGVATFNSAQSQEKKTVVVVSNCPPTRAALYTGSTRGSKNVILILSTFALKASLDDANCVRQSLLCNKIQHAIGAYLDKGGDGDDDSESFESKANRYISTQYIPVTDDGRDISVRVDSANKPDVFPAIKDWMDRVLSSRR